MTENTINPKNGVPYYEPFTIEKVDQSVLELQRSPEDKEYYVLYYNLEYEEFKWKKFIGRYDTYFGIKQILDSESIDIRSSIVIVETVGIDPSTNKGKRYLNHPDNSSSIIDFCHYVEKFFGDNAYSIDEYDTGPVNELEESSSDDSVWNMVSKTIKPSSAPLLKDQEERKEYFTPIIIDSNVESHKI